MENGFLSFSLPRLQMFIYLSLIYLTVESDIPLEVHIHFKIFF